MAGADNRWWGPRSDFPWEEDALKHIRNQMPSAEPYRAWQTFTFTAQSGHVREVDLLIAVPAGLFLVEIKSHPGRATNQGPTWLFHGDDRVRTIENPLHLTDRKCKELKSQLGWAADKLGIRTRLPFIQPAVFLSAPDLRCEFDEVQRTMVFGRDGLTEQTGLHGIWTGLLGQDPRSAGSRVDPALSRQLEKLLQKIGIQGLRKHRKIGPFKLAPRAFDTGPTWEDYLAENPALPGDQVRAGSASTCRTCMPRKQNGTPRGGPPAASTWPCRESRTRASSRRSSSAMSMRRARRSSSGMAAIGGGLTISWRSKAARASRSRQESRWCASLPRLLTMPTAGTCTTGH